MNLVLNILVSVSRFVFCVNGCVLDMMRLKVLLNSLIVVMFLIGCVVEVMLRFVYLLFSVFMICGVLVLCSFSLMFRYVCDSVCISLGNIRVVKDGMVVIFKIFCGVCVKRLSD